MFCDSQGRGLAAFWLRYTKNTCVEYAMPKISAVPIAHVTRRRYDSLSVFVYMVHGDDLIAKVSRTLSNPR